MEPSEILGYVRILQSYQKNETPVYMKFNVEVNDYTPFIGSIRETYGYVTAVDDQRCSIRWDTNWVPHPSLRNFPVRTNDLMPISVAKYLVPKDVYESSEAFYKAINREVTLSPGQLVYLSARYKGLADENNPKVGSNYEKHGKVMAIMFNRNKTVYKVAVRWFLSHVDQHYAPEDLLTAKEFNDQRFNDTVQYIYTANDPLISPDTKFISENGYFKSLDNKFFFQQDKFHHLFEKLNPKKKK